MLPPGDTLAHILAHHLETAPDRGAVVLMGRSSETHLTVRQLLDGAGVYADQYKASGVRPGEVVVDLLPPGAPLLFAFLGGVLMGAVPCVLPFPTEKLDPVRYRENLTALIQVTHPAAMVAEPAPSFTLYVAAPN